MQNKSIRLTLLGGVNEVGGNNILLEDLEYVSIELINTLGILVNLNPKILIFNLR